MPVSSSNENDFINQITELVEANISNEQFGVSELAEAVRMSRSNLLRKVKKHTNLSVSQFIRNVRLQLAKEMLKETSFTVSEISYKVGFGSPSYFIKCFGELYGSPPGELGKQELKSDENIPVPPAKKIPVFLISVVAVLLIATVLYALLKPKSRQENSLHKSIAVLPFINDSSDSSNVYIINGLMEATLNNLQQMKELSVISRTSVEKYRNHPKTTPEIAKELNANYLIVGSGQKIDKQILLNIQLIEAATDKQLWSKQYKRGTRDIFALQAQVAKNIAEEIQVVLTPEEEERIDKTPTTNLVAYDYFLQGLNLLNNPVADNVENSLPYFYEAIKHDNKFARSYAAIAIAYYLLDEGKLEKQFPDSINYYADQALFFDSKLPQSLIAKALFYMAHNEHELAVPYFEKALEISPNNDLVLIFMVDLYVHHLPNTAKYLEYALKGLEIDLVAAYDSATASYSYLHISNAFIQSGFINEAEKYINLSLNYLPDNLYSEYVKAYILYAKNESLEQLKQSLLQTFQKDSTRLDVMQEVAKTYYYLGDYETSYKYYKPFAEIREAYKLDIYGSENYKLGYVFNQLGQTEEGNKYFEDYRELAENTQSIYKHYNLALYYSYKGEIDKAIEHLKLFSEEENFHYWLLLFTPIEPVAMNMQKHPDYKKVFKTIEEKFERYNTKLGKNLKSKGLL